MNKYFRYGVLAILPFAFVACSDDEEILEPTIGANDNSFAVPVDATGPEAELRRDFFNQTGVYLLFSDVLDRVYSGVDSNGNEVWNENKIDFRYNLTSYSIGGAPEFVYLTSQDEKDAASELILTYVWPHIEGGKLSPYSILPVESMRAYNGSKMADAYTTSCWRCLAIATGEWIQAEEDQKAQIAKIVLKNLVSSKFTAKSEAAQPFRTLSLEYSSMDMDEIYEDWYDDPSIERVYEIGFLSYISNSWFGDYLPSADRDFEAYFNLLFDKEENEVIEIYGDYDAIMTKYYILRNAVSELGYKF